METNTQESQPISWLDRPLLTTIKLNWEVILFALILIVAIVTRFYDLGARVMSHDESLHTYYSWRLFKGFGFEHTPLMHGPLQFHALAFFYFLFGDSDFSARIFAALTSIATIAFLWKYRRYLGRTGTLIAAVMFTISPYLLYYGRYVRNEAYVGLFGLVSLWAVLRYMESGQNRYLYWLTAMTALHFTAKETSFIYVAQILVFLGLVFIQQMSQEEWTFPEGKRRFLWMLMGAFGLLFLAVLINGFTTNITDTTGIETVVPAVPGETDTEALGAPSNPLVLILGGGGIFAFLGALYYLITGYTLEKLRTQRVFGVMLFLLMLVAPHLVAFPVELAGFKSVDYTPAGIARTAMFLVPIALLSVGVGYWWKREAFVVSLAIFYAIFVVFFTTIFTNGQGFFTGMVGSLGYWIEQQGVQRGSQPWYYYVLIQIPIYEFLPAIGSLLALFFAGRNWLSGQINEPTDPIEPDMAEPGFKPAPAVALFAYWTVTSIAAYTIAGEKMPWLTYHIAIPMILMTAWCVGRIIDTTDWRQLLTQRVWSVVASLVVFFPALVATIAYLMGPTPPFQGSELAQLQATSNFMLSILTAGGSGFVLVRLLRTWEAVNVRRVVLLTVFALLSILTARTAFIASFVNYDEANEYIVYAHSARGVKDVLTQVEEISRRTSGYLSMPVAYDDDVSWPFTWYLRNYENQKYYAANPTRDLRESPVIIVGDNNFAKIEPVVARGYHEFEYIRMVWPDQDYFNLTGERVRSALTNPQMRGALFNIWLNRNFKPYSEIVGRDMSLAQWRPADLMRMYVRKDVTAQIWDYGLAATTAEENFIDPYEGKDIDLRADTVIGSQGVAPGQFQAPRGLAVAADGSLYVADSRNHRIQHLSATGDVLNVWGSFSDSLTSAAPGGTFNEPWDVAIGPDGSVYVADTWNHRIQRFTADGEFVQMWGYFGTAETPDAFWGPRSVDVDEAGRVYVTDTGNKRIVIFDANGVGITEFGSVGLLPGQFDEPVGVAVDPNGRVYVADTWNQRMQVFSLSPAEEYEPALEWEIIGWYGSSLENKPFVAVDDAQHLYIADPEGYRVLEYNTLGEFVRYWGDFSTGPEGFGLVSGLAVDGDGGVWVSDGANNRLLRFTMPEQ